MSVHRGQRPLKSHGADLDVSLFFASLDEREALQLVVGYLLEGGAASNGLFSYREGPPGQPFYGVSDLPRSWASWNGKADLGELIGSTEVWPMSFTLVGVGGMDFAVAVEVRYGLSQEAVTDGHPVTIIFPAEYIFDEMVTDRGVEHRPTALYASVRRLFLDMCQDMTPDYGGVFFEYSMQPPRFFSELDVRAADTIFVSESVGLMADSVVDDPLFVDGGFLIESPRDTVTNVGRLTSAIAWLAEGLGR